MERHNTRYLLSCILGSHGNFAKKSSTVVDSVSKRTWGIIGKNTQSRDLLLMSRYILSQVKFDKYTISQNPNAIIEYIKAQVGKTTINRGVNGEGVICEKFLVDFLSRFLPNSFLNFINLADYDFDKLMATDAIMGIKNNHYQKGDPESLQNPKIGVQLTIGDSFEKKCSKYRGLVGEYKLGLHNETLKNYSVRNMFDFLTVIQIRGSLSRHIENGNSPLSDAFNNWKTEGYSTGGPSTFLNKEVKLNFELLSYYLQEIYDNYFYFHNEDNEDNVVELVKKIGFIRLRPTNGKTVFGKEVFFRGSHYTMYLFIPDGINLNKETTFKLQKGNETIFSINIMKSGIDKKAINKVRNKWSHQSKVPQRNIGNELVQV